MTKALIKTVEGLKEVQASPLIRGLVFNESVAHPGTVSITHVHSGMFILDGVLRTSVRGVAQLLTKADWSLPASAIYTSPKHRRVMDRAERLLAKDRRTSFSQKRESRVAKELGTRPQPGSGSRPHYKRDHVTALVMVEHKTTLPESAGYDRFYLEIKDLEFLRKQALELKKVPAYWVEFGGRDAIIVIPMEDYEIEDDGISMAEVDCRDKKSLPLTLEMSQRLSSSSHITFITQQREWVGMTQACFLAALKD